MYKLGDAKKMAGFSLIELMIAATLGLFVLAAVTAVMISTITTNSSNLSMIRLDQDLRTVMQLMVNDIRRAGSWARADRDISDRHTPPTCSTPCCQKIDANCNPFMQGAVISLLCSNSNNCSAGAVNFPCNPVCRPVPAVAAPAVTSTDITTVIPIPNPPAPTVPATLITTSVSSNCIVFTYDLNNDGVLQTANPDERFGYRLDNRAIYMRSNGATCADPIVNWGERITDPAALIITDLNFTINSMIMDIPGTRVTLAGNDARTIMRNVNIRVTGQANIGGNQTATRTIQQDVRVRNDRYIPGT